MTRKRTRRPVEYLLPAICVAVIFVMLWPLVMSFIASVKPAAEASSVPRQSPESKGLHK